jgi:hypothetical protein
MPGGFTSGNTEGYQTVDEPRPSQRTRPAASGPVPQTHTAQPQGTPGAYQPV